MCESTGLVFVIFVGIHHYVSFNQNTIKNWPGGHTASYQFKQKL